MWKSIVVFSLLLSSLYLQGEEFDPLRFLRERMQIFHAEQILLDHYSIEEVVYIAEQWMHNTAQLLLIQEDYRRLNPKAVGKAWELLNEEQPKMFIKINEDALTRDATAEWMAELILWEYLQKKTGACFCIQSSENKIAMGLATLLAESLGTCAQPVPVWNKVVSNLPEGGTEKRVNQEMQEELVRPLCTHTIFIALTYDEQLKAIKGLTKVALEDIGLYGFILVTSEHVESFPQGFFLQTIEPFFKSEDLLQSASHAEHSLPLDEAGFYGN